MGNVAHTWGVQTWVGIEEGKEKDFDPHPEITALGVHADDDRYVADTNWGYKNHLTFEFPEGPHESTMKAWHPYN